MDRYNKYCYSFIYQDFTPICQYFRQFIYYLLTKNASRAYIRVGAGSSVCLFFEVQPKWNHYRIYSGCKLSTDLHRRNNFSLSILTVDDECPSWNCTSEDLLCFHMVTMPPGLPTFAEQDRLTAVFSFRVVFAGFIENSGISAITWNKKNQLINNNLALPQI